MYINDISVFFRRAAAAVGALAAMAGAVAQPNVTVQQSSRDYQVKADGSYVLDQRAVWRINTDQGVKQKAQASFTYSASLASLEVVQAYTTTQAGLRIDLKPEQMQLQQSPQSTGAAMFGDLKVLTLVFPAVEVNSVLTMHLRRTQKKALVDGHFSAVETPDYMDETQALAVSVRAPAAMPLQAEAIGFQGGREKQGAAPGEQLWRWTLKDALPVKLEAASVHPIDYGARLAITSFTSFEAVAKSYAQRAAPQARLTPALQAQADQLTAALPATDKRAQAEALYRWVSANIRYVAIFLEQGGVVPHTAQEVMDNRYGDCKDHVVLLEALLAAKGIRSQAVLVDAGGSYLLPKVPMSPGLFNHAISYLPDFDLFVDSTAAVAGFGVLPFTEYGKTALVVGDAKQPPRLATLPLADARRDQVQTTTTLRIDAQGNLTGATTLETKGVFDLFYRSLLATVPPQAKPQVAQQLLAMSGQQGTGELNWGAPADLSKPLNFNSSFKLPGYAPMPGPGAFTLPVGLSGFTTIANSIEPFAPETRTLALPMLNRRIVEHISIELPEGVTEPRLPRAATLTAKFARYESSHKLEGRTIKVQRVLELTLPTVLLQPQDYAELRGFAMGVARDLKAQYLY